MFKNLICRVPSVTRSRVGVRAFTSTRTLFSAEESKPVSPEVQAIVDDVLKLNIMQTLELVKVLKTTFGYTDASFAVAAPAAAAPAAAAAPVEEAAPAAAAKTHFTLKLESFDAKDKVKVIKEVRTLTGKGLKEAKDLVEGCPQILKKDVNKEEAEKLVALFKDNGAVLVME